MENNYKVADINENTLRKIQCLEKELCQCGKQDLVLIAYAKDNNSDTLKSNIAKKDDTED